MRGPLNPSLNESAGLLIDGFDDRAISADAVQPARVRASISKASGYAKVKDLYAWIYEHRAAAARRLRSSPNG